MTDHAPLDFEGLASLPQGTRLVAYGPDREFLVGDLVDVVSAELTVWPHISIGERTHVRLYVDVFGAPHEVRPQPVALALGHWRFYTVLGDNTRRVHEEAALSVRVAAFRPIAHRRRPRVDLRAFPWPGLLATIVFGTIVIGGIRLGLMFTGGAL